MEIHVHSLAFHLGRIRAQECNRFSVDIMQPQDTTVGRFAPFQLVLIEPLLVVLRRRNK